MLSRSILCLFALVCSQLLAERPVDPNRIWQGIPGIERTAKGRVFSSWFTGGPKEPSPDNEVLLCWSDDGAKSFTTPQVMAEPKDGTRCFDPCLWIDPKGRLWYLFNRGNKDSAQHDVWARISDEPDAKTPVFGEAFRVGFDVPFAFRMNKVTALSSGEWIMPVTLAKNPVHAWSTGYNEQQEPTLHGVGISTDEGKTWNLHGAVASKPWALENMITELKDGRLWMLIRTSSGVLWQSYSIDKGRTWSEGAPSTIASPGSRFFIRRLASGNLLLVNHYKFKGRSHLTAQISTDDGATWNDGLLLDERSGVSYPDGVQDKDGLIWITYDRDRGGAGEILLAKFKEQDVVTGRNASGGVTLKRLINKLDKSKLVSAPSSAVSFRATAPSSEESAAAARWAQSNFSAAKAGLPFSFMLGGKKSIDLLRDWKRTDATHELDAQRSERTRSWTDAATGLHVRLVATEYADFPVVEWTVWLKNTGTADTPIIENIQGLDARFEREASGEFVLHGLRGDSCLAESFRPFALTLGPDAVKRCSPPVAGDKVSGKSSDGPDGWPYWNLQRPSGGVILAVGWPGQWEATFTRNHERSLHVKAGQQLTHLVLKPGEEIRTPSTTLLFWQGDDVVRAQNLWRSWYLAHVLPRIGGQPQPTTTQIQTGGSLADWPKVQAYIDASIKPDICWRDAGGGNTWYPSSGGPFTDPKKIWLNTGTWEVDTAKYPQGFKPFSDKVRANGMQFLLWFEPERVGDPNSWLGKNHPEWLMPGNSAGDVLNLGDPAALNWLINHIDGMVKSQGLDWYREDLNGGNYGTAWRKHDAPDRQGITENLYVQGHLAFWDELRRRNPHLHIDSCASGGRRNDLETMRRSVPLLRSDWSVTAFAKDPLQIEGNQAQTYSLSSWLPWQGAGVPFLTDTYAVRSYYLTGFGMIAAGDWTKDEQKRFGTIRGYTEARRVGPLLLGDYYPLTPYSLDKTSWIAWQFHRPDLNEGLVQAFRRPEAASETITVKLRGLDPQQRYEVENLEGGKEVHTGEELMRGYDITLREKPAAAVLVLRAIK